MQLTKPLDNYVALHRPEGFDEKHDPDINFGEAKSFSEGDTLKPKDIARLQDLALQFPGCLIQAVAIHGWLCVQ